MLKVTVLPQQLQVQNGLQWSAWLVLWELPVWDIAVETVLSSGASIHGIIDNVNRYIPNMNTKKRMLAQR